MILMITFSTFYDIWGLETVIYLMLKIQMDSDLKHHCMLTDHFRLKSTS